jgi:methylglutaconyl-CoA hydratase
MQQPPILVESRGTFVLITLNRPERRNALTIELIAQLIAAVRGAGADASKRAIILRGAGESFCTGMDLKEAQALPAGHERIPRSVAEMLLTVHSSPLPTIAAVHGHAMAGGAGLMAACDLAVAARGTKIGYPEVRRGLVPALVATLLRHQVGERALRELFLTAEPIDADRARELGLINRVVDGGADQALDEAMKIASTISQGAPGALAATKELLGKLKPTTLEHDFQTALRYHEQARSGAEAAEGIAAFVEKRKPNWDQSK